MSVKLPISTTALFLSALSLHAMPPSCRPLNSFEQGSELRQNQIMAAYNATARIDVRGSWDVYTMGGYIYWQPREENLELGIENNTDTTIDGRVINMNYRFQSGIKAGLGIFSDWDNWDVYAEYTWLSGHQRTSSTAPDDGVIYPFWGHPAYLPETSIVSAKGKWKLELNILDTQLARSYYVGTKLTFRPFIGARAAWINQKYTAIYQESDSSTYEARNSSHSWGLGPETGILTHWLLGYGIRAIGSLEADVLFTRYNTSMHEPEVSLYQRHASYLRPHTDLELGFGYGTYFNNHNYHIDILGVYGFQVFWNQNMFRFFSDDIAPGKSFAPNGDLYIHGVTGELRLDF